MRGDATGPRASPACAEREVLLLATGGPGDVLARIVPGDALGLRARVAALVARRALLLDVERVLLRAQVLCALRAPSWRGEPALERWKDERVREAVASVLEEDGREGEAAPLPFAGALGLDAAALGRACARFNALPPDERRAFLALVLDAERPDPLARGLGVSLSELARRARAGLDLLLEGRPRAVRGPELAEAR